MNLDRKTIVLKKVGNVILKKSSIARYLGIRIKPFEGVIVTIPKRVSYKEAEEFVKSREDWIIKHLPKIQKIENSQIVFNEESEYRTKEHKLVISQRLVESTVTSISNSEIKVEYPLFEDVNSSNIQNEIKDAINSALRIEAKKHLPMRIKELAHLYGFKYNRVTVKTQKSRWGSCSGKNNINLNIHLMKLPDELIDYVILHELVHTVHKNHSKNFWNALEKVFPNCKKVDKKLKLYSPQKY